MKLFHFLHKWTKWSYPVPGYAATTIQFKACEVCRKVKYRKVGFAGQTGAKDQVSAIKFVEGISDD